MILVSGFWLLLWLWALLSFRTIRCSDLQWQAKVASCAESLYITFPNCRNMSMLATSAQVESILTADELVEHTRCLLCRVL